MAGKSGECRLLKKLVQLGVLNKASYPDRDVVKAKYPACLEYGKKLKTLKTHLRNTHGILPQE
jgi:predicted transcriptional regulator